MSGDGAILDLTGASAKYYVMAITCLTDVKFGGTGASGLGILNGGVNLGMGNTHFASAEDTQTLDDDWGATTNAADYDSDLVVLDGSGTVFPKGITIYDMYDYIVLHSGDIICYVAPRPDYRDRA